MKLVNVPAFIAKKALKENTIQTFNNGGVKYFVKPSDTETNRLVIDHIEVADSVYLSYPELALPSEKKAQEAKAE